jgi:tetratricopeptide (TPR) repeat protein
MSTYGDALMAFDQGRFEQAIDLFNAAIQASDNIANAYSKRGVCHVRLNHRDDAERDFRAALREDERCLSALVNLGNLTLEQGDLDEAKLYYDRALRIDETYASAHYNLGVLLRRKGDIAGSVRELRLAAKYEARPQAARRRLSWWKRR